MERDAGNRVLFGNRWIHLFAFDNAGHMAWRYSGGLDLVPVVNAGLAEARPELAA